MDLSPPGIESELIIGQHYARIWDCVRHSSRMVGT
jgi:hypothetical protein